MGYPLWCYYPKQQKVATWVIDTIFAVQQYAQKIDDKSESFKLILPALNFYGAL